MKWCRRLPTSLSYTRKSIPGVLAWRHEARRGEARRDGTRRGETFTRSRRVSLPPSRHSEVAWFSRDFRVERSRKIKTAQGPRSY